jgi:TatD DNase family protein
LRVNPCGIEIVDTHVHLCDPLFDPDRAEVLARARAGGITAVIAVGENLADARKNLELAILHPMMRPAAGLYPTLLSFEQAEEMALFIRIHRDSLYAIGEVGLDHWAVQDDMQRDVQREIFIRSIALAKELNLPLNVHSRSAGRQAVNLLLERGATRVQLHAFDGRSSAALPASEAGFFFSIPPSIARSEQKQKLVRRLPLACLLAETDSPVLGPAAGERNEPVNAILSIQAIAAIKGISETQVAEAVKENTRRLYGELDSRRKISDRLQRHAH